MNSLPDTNPLLDAALAAHAEGLCIIPSKSDGTKAPFGNWKQYQTERPSEDQLLTWFGPHLGMGVVCGAVSGRLECVDIEGAFAFRYEELRTRLDSAGLLEEWDRWLSGYAERTAGGGVHVLVRIEGEGKLPGNTKLALGPDNQCWIETRGEGGFVIVAPSGGTVHPSGKPWLLKAGGFDQIAYTTIELWDAILDICASFDESPASDIAPPPVNRAQHNGEGWIGEALSAYPSLQEVLQHHGWQYVRDEPLGQLWRRPGKQFGHSARINGSGRLVNFSSSTPLPLGKRTFDAVDVDLAYELGHIPSLDERTAALREFKPSPPNTSAVTRLDDTAVAAGGEGGLNLPDDFWLSRPYLAHIYQAALASRVAPDALWMATKVMYAATIPWNFRLPDDGTLDYIGVMVGPSGSGKSLSKQTAINLLGPEFSSLHGIALGLPPGTGEGMTEIYLKRDKDGSQSMKLRGAGFYVDEGTWLFDVAGRSGNTTIQALKSAWSGELTGSLAGTAERNRFLPPRAVRFAMLIGIQPGVAAKFMAADLTDGGLPQRVCWSWAQHPHWPDEGTEHPGPLHLEPWTLGEHEPVMEITYCPEIKHLLDSQRRAAVTGVGSVALNGHEAYAKLKSAALHALLDGRTHVEEEDWLLASTEWSVSETVRNHIQRTERASAADSVRQRGVARAYEDAAAEGVHLQRGVMALAKRAAKTKEPMTRTDISSALSSYRRRHGISYQEIIDAAIERGYIVKDGEGYRQGPLAE